MPEAASQGARRPSVFTIPSHYSFADSLVAGLLARFGDEPLSLAGGRLLLPNNRAVRTVTEAFVRASRGGLVLPRLIAIGDPDLDDRIGEALDPADNAEPAPPAIDPLARQLALASIARRQGEGAAESLRIAAELGRTLDALTVEEVPAARLADIAADDPELARHWQLSLERLRSIIQAWPAEMALRGLVDLAERRNRLLRSTARRWLENPTPGFTIAAGISTAAPAVAALLSAVARLPEGSVVLPGLALASVLPDEEWDALGPEEDWRGEQSHPQFHLKQLLDRIGVARGEVATWRGRGRAASPAVRGRAVAHAMAAASFSDKWSRLPPNQRRLTGIRAIELPDSSAEATAIALALRESLETPGQTAALVTPDRALAGRVSALLGRWGIEADDSAGKPLSQSPAGTLILAIAAAAAENFAPVSLLALLKHPLVGGEDEQRRAWLDNARSLDEALRGPRPAAGIAGLDRHFTRKASAAWDALRPRLAVVAESIAGPLTLSGLAAALREATASLCGDRAWTGPDGRMAGDLVAELETSGDAGALALEQDDWVPVLRHLMESKAVRPPYGGHPRIFIWGLLEARLQNADFVVLGGLNEGVWPALPPADPWLAPSIRAQLGLPSLDHRIGLTAHDFASALGAPRVLLTRARRDSKSPTVASRLWLRLEAMTGGLARDHRLERLVRALDDPGPPQPAERPQPCPPPAQRPDRISVTAVDRLKADPFAFYAQAVLKLRRLDPVDDDHTAAWKGTAVHKVFQTWLDEDGCDPARLRPRAELLLRDDTIHPMLRALWAPRLLEAIDWIAELELTNRAAGRRPLRAEAHGEAPLAGIIVYGRADRIDSLAGDGLAVIDYKTGAPPTQKAVDAGFALQLGLLGLIGRAGGFECVRGDPIAFEYWSLQRHNGKYGRLMRPDKDLAPGEFLEHAFAHFAEAAGRWLTGNEPFTAKLNPAFAPYGDYDQLMRLEEWYGRK